MIGESPKVYEEMLGSLTEMSLYLRIPDLSTEIPGLLECKEYFLRVEGLPEESGVWIN